MGWLWWRGRLSVAALLIAACSAGDPVSPARAQEVYPLDEISRTIPAKGRVQCPEVELATYKGTTLKYSSPLRVQVDFQGRLQLFEEVVRDVAIEVYGRAPTRIVHLGTYNCRRIAAYPTWLSEHGLGNAIDVSGFEFGKAPKGAVLPPDVPASLRRSFKVNMLRHWDGSRGADAVHSTFLRTLATRLIARPDIFRVLLGPAFPGHRNHFHFDCAPWRMVEIFESEDGAKG